MFKGEFEFDLFDMRRSSGVFKPQYLGAYPYTNEPIERWLALSPIKGKSVLSVAASGDQALFYATNGASRVDTFDKTVLACMVMDFKTTALKMHIKHKDYMYLVNHLHDLVYCERYRNPNLSTKIFDRVVAQMPDRTREIIPSFIHTHPGYKIEHCVFSMLGPTQTPNPELYKRMHKIQLPNDKQFNFIWADLMNVHNYIDTKYDIIYLSNIFDHYINISCSYSNKPNNYKAIWKSLNSLWPHLNVGGHILFTAADGMRPKQKYKSVYSIFKFIEFASKTLPINASIKCTRDKHWATIFIQKTR